MPVLWEVAGSGQVAFRTFVLENGTGRWPRPGPTKLTGVGCTSLSQKGSSAGWEAPGQGPSCLFQLLLPQTPGCGQLLRTLPVSSVSQTPPTLS